METVEELRERLNREFPISIEIEKVIQLARIAESLDRIEKEGIFTYARELREADEEEENIDICMTWEKAKALAEEE